MEELARMSQARFIIRWDDISPLQDRKKYRTLVNLFLKYNKPAVLGVIPDNRDKSISFDQINHDSFIDELKELQHAGWEIAQHGFRHIQHNRNGGLLNLNRASEFAGRDLADQLSDLREGRRLLNDFGFDPVTFIPPWHAFDNSTITALSRSGFKILSDGLFLYPRKFENLLQLPMIFWTVPNRLKTLNRLGSVYTICLHPQLMTDDDLHTLEKFFTEFQPQIITAASLLNESESLTESGFKRSILERIFAMTYKRQG